MSASRGGLAVLLVMLAACGGDGSNGGASPVNFYTYVPPVLNSSRVYAETIVDNSNNTIDIGYSVAVEAVNADGSAVELEQSTTGSSVTVNGTNYAVPTETISDNGAGQETGYVVQSVVPNVSCTLDPHGGGPDWPLQVGQTWSNDYSLTCGSSTPVAYTQTGSVVDVELITVPAGTFMALKLQSTVSWTSATGVARTQTITTWRDVGTSHAVKESISIAVSGTLPATGYAVSREIMLQSMT